MEFDLNSWSKVIPYWEGRDIGQYSDHITVWLDKHIGREGQNDDLKLKFRTDIHPLTTLDHEEAEVDPPLHLDPEILELLKDRVYFLKAFFDPEECLKFINLYHDRKIFFITSGSMGEHFLSRIAGLPQIQEILIFCGNISHHVHTWAMNYTEIITAMLDYQTNLLLRLTKDIAKYIEDKGNQHMAHFERNGATTCYAWAIKLTLRAKKLGDTKSKALLDILVRKFEDAEPAGGVAPVEHMEQDQQ
ncbi:unnamed protein product [Didymodactylos carnosus]|uniref:Uncharacterized protein n=1 Tax=Didymodactylos carnosus TaxID=1234261 RepID=A0A815VT62_9BILA|nr:unnamed protein product [Didymodactylos carnosus]CAF4392302.1 unnamed protein product [Didymodactylos carnosus]